MSARGRPVKSLCAFRGKEAKARQQQNSENSPMRSHGLEIGDLPRRTQKAYVPVDNVKRPVEHLEGVVEQLESAQLAIEKRPNTLVNQQNRSRQQIHLDYLLCFQNL
eukprot:5964635-Amphidinium_carterae.1